MDSFIPYIDKVKDFLSYEIRNNTLYEYAWAIVIFLIVVVLVKIFKKIIIIRIKTLCEGTATTIDDNIIDFVESLPSYFYWTLYLYIPLKYLQLNPTLDKMITGIFLFVLLIQAIRLSIIALEYAFVYKTKGKKPDKTTLSMFKIILKIVFWAVGLLLILSNIGIEVTPLIASFGISGIAVAFAFQNILEDIFSSFSIYMDRPFKVGDFIMLGDGSMGTVKKIGIKTTRLQSLEGEEIIVSNKSLTNATISNYGVMPRRRMVFTLGVIYETSPAKLRKIPDMIRKIVENADKELVSFDRVNFTTFGDFSLNFECVYFIEKGDKALSLQIQEKINYELFEQFAKAKIEFAYPTQVVYTAKL